MAPEAVKHILVCADDFGMHCDVDHAVLALAERGRLSGTSCLVHGPSFEAAAPALRSSGLQCGLHLNFTEPLEAGGLFMPLAKLIRACWLQTIDRDHVTRHITQQFERYEAVMGRAPDYIDGHQHVHQFPVIREALLDVLDQRYASRGERPWIRSTQAGSQAGIPAALRVKSGVIQMLGAGRMRRLSSRRGYELNADFLGVYDFQGGEQGYARLLAKWLAQSRARTLIMCHPASEALPGDPLGAQRLAEFQTWKSDRVGQWLSDFNLAIVSRDTR